MKTKYNILTEAAQIYNNILFSKEGKDALNYIQSRGISIDTVKHMKLGYAPNENLFSKYDKLNFELEEIEEAGLITNYSGRYYDALKNYIMFPNYQDHYVKTITGRLVPNKSNSASKKKHMHLKGSEKIIFNSNVILNLNTIYVVESVFNALSMIEWGYNGVVALLGTYMTNHIDPEIFMDKKIYLLFDNDENESGQKAAIRFCEKVFFNNYINPYICTMPVGIDINDYFLNNEKYMFINEIINKAMKYTSTQHVVNFIENKVKKRDQHRYYQKLKISQIKYSKDIETYRSIPIENILSDKGIAYEVNGYNNRKKCNCVFHIEKTPSMILYPNNTFKCYGCGEQGDVIKLAQHLTKYTFVETLTYLEKFI